MVSNSDYEIMHKAYAEALSKILELEAQLAEARRDGARLDWFEKNHRYVAVSTGFRGSKDAWVWRDRSAALATHEAKTLRAAIDAAMKEAK